MHILYIVFPNIERYFTKKNGKQNAARFPFTVKQGSGSISVNQK